MFFSVGTTLSFSVHEAIYQFVPYFWITLGLILIEGMLEGGVYVNTFYFISKNVSTTSTAFTISKCDLRKLKE